MAAWCRPGGGSGVGFPEELVRGVGAFGALDGDPGELADGAARELVGDEELALGVGLGAVAGVEVAPLGRERLDVVRRVRRQVLDPDLDVGALRVLAVVAVRRTVAPR